MSFFHEINTISSKVTYILHFFGKRYRVEFYLHTAMDVTKTGNGEQGTGNRSLGTSVQQ